MLMGWDGSFVVGKREERLGEQLLFTFSIILKESNALTNLLRTPLYLIHMCGVVWIF